jgi:hypothetical protein
VTTRHPGRPDEPGHDEPVKLDQALAEWAAGRHEHETEGVTDVRQESTRDGG